MTLSARQAEAPFLRQSLAVSSSAVVVEGKEAGWEPEEECGGQGGRPGPSGAGQVEGIGGVLEHFGGPAGGGDVDGGGEVT